MPSYVQMAKDDGRSAYSVYVKTSCPFITTADKAGCTNTSLCAKTALLYIMPIALFHNLRLTVGKYAWVGSCPANCLHRGGKTGMVNCF